LLPNQRQLLESAGLLALAYLGLLALSLGYGREYAGLLLPLYRWEIAHLAQDYQIQSLLLGESHGEGMVMLTVITRYLAVGEHIIPPGISISSSTLAAFAAQPPMLILSLAVAWPASAPVQRIARLFCALPFLLLVEMLDIPLILIGNLQDLIMANFPSENGSFMIAWMNFLNGGGRPAISVFAGIMAVACSKLLFPRPDRK
jgi:hypothetical protein